MACVVCFALGLSHDCAPFPHQDTHDYYISRLISVSPLATGLINWFVCSRVRSTRVGNATAILVFPLALILFFFCVFVTQVRPQDIQRHQGRLKRQQLLHLAGAVASLAGTVQEEKVDSYFVVRGKFCVGWAVDTGGDVLVTPSSCFCLFAVDKSSARLTLATVFVAGG